MLELSTLRGRVADLNTKKEELKDERNKWKNIAERILDQLASLFNDTTHDTEFCGEDPKEYDFVSVTFLHKWIDRYG